LSDAPRWIANLAADYARPIGAGAVLKLGADYGFRSGYYGHLDDSRYSRLGNVGITNVQLGVELTASRIKIQAWAKNIADVRYLESYPLGGATIYGAYFGTIGAGRAIGLTAAKRF
jgi:iron complex outermembrane receptor protein